MVGVGFKASKLNFFPTAYQSDFLNQIKENYEPIATAGKAQVVAESMFALASGNTNYNVNSGYNQFIHFGLILEKTLLKPSLSLNFGSETPILKGPLILNNYDYFDNEFASGHNTFTELKLGSAISLTKKENSNFYLIVNAAYQWYSYHNISYDGVPLSAYTTGDIAADYQKVRHFYLSLSLICWTR